MQIASDTVGSTYVVGVVPTPEVGAVFTLIFDVASTLEGDTSSVRSRVHLFYVSMWYSVRTLVSELKILQWFIFSIVLTGAILLNISRRSAATMIVWSSSEIVGMRACVGNSFYVPLLVQYLVFGLLKFISR